MQLFLAIFFGILIIVGAGLVFLIAKVEVDPRSSLEPQKRPPAIKRRRPDEAPRPGQTGSLTNVIAFVDVETTGLTANDRVVTFGCVRMDLKSKELSTKHLAFNPGRNSHWQARQVHGYADEDLKWQDDFSKWAPEIHSLLSGADLIVAHNAAFDLKFIDRELALAGQPPISAPIYCTMIEYRRRNPGESAKLTNVAAQIGMARAGDRHGALEDAWLAMMVYFSLQRMAVRPDEPSMAYAKPENWKAPPVTVELDATPRKRGRPRKAPVTSTSISQPPAH